MTAIVLDWLYCFFRGFQNQIVLYFDKKDVFISILGPLAFAAAYWAFRSTSDLVGMVLVASGIVAAFCTIRSSIRRNKSVAVGCAVGLFKVTFSVLWIGLVVGQLGRGGGQDKSISERRLQMFFGLIVFVLLLFLMDKLINGPMVYARRQGANPQPA